MFENFVNADSKKSTDELHQMLNNNPIKMDIDEDLSNNQNQNENKKQNQKQEQKDYTNIDNLKELIYKTYSKSVDKGKSLQKKEKKKMKKIMNLLIYLQMRKIELKLNYFNDFEKLIQFETQQMKSMESQIIQDRIKLS